MRATVMDKKIKIYFPQMHKEFATFAKTYEIRNSVLSGFDMFLPGSKTSADITHSILHSDQAVMAQAVLSLAEVDYKTMTVWERSLARCIESAANQTMALNGHGIITILEMKEKYIRNTSINDPYSAKAFSPAMRSIVERARVIQEDNIKASLSSGVL